MAGKQKQYSPEFKLKVVLESLQRDTTLEEVCRKFEVSSLHEPSQGSQKPLNGRKRAKSHRLHFKIYTNCWKYRVPIYDLIFETK